MLDLPRPGRLVALTLASLLLAPRQLAVAEVRAEATAPRPDVPAVTESLNHGLTRAWRRAEGALPGMVVRVDAPGLHWSGARGSADLDSATPLRPGQPLRIASATKTFTAAAVLRLVDQGRLELDRPVAGLLPPRYDSALRRGGYQPARITVRELLAHTSGLDDFGTDPAYQRAVLSHPDRRWTPLRQVRWAMSHGHRLGRPGSHCHYSDTGYVLLARIIVEVTGRSQAGAYRRWLGFDRLGLHATWFETLEHRPRAADPGSHQYFLDPAHDLQVDLSRLDPSYALYGGGGLASTLHDQDRFYATLFTHRLLTDAELRQMTRLTPTGDRGQAGLGTFPLVLHGTRCWWHNGFVGVAVLTCPAAHLTASATTQAFTTDRDAPGRSAIGARCRDHGTRLPVRTTDDLPGRLVITADNRLTPTGRNHAVYAAPSRATPASPQGGPGRRHDGAPHCLTASRVWPARRGSAPG
jgi:D-alanyl-D-alanine carboxypeptidase